VRGTKIPLWWHSKFGKFPIPAKFRYDPLPFLFDIAGSPQFELHKFRLLPIKSSNINSFSFGLQDLTPETLWVGHERIPKVLYLVDEQGWNLLILLVFVALIRFEGAARPANHLEYFLALSALLPWLFWLEVFVILLFNVFKGIGAYDFIINFVPMEILLKIIKQMLRYFFDHSIFMNGCFILRVPSLFKTNG
jgi:hypothetical protein